MNLPFHSRFKSRAALSIRYVSHRKKEEKMKNKLCFLLIALLAACSAVNTPLEEPLQNQSNLEPQVTEEKNTPVPTTALSESPASVTFITEDGVEIAGTQFGEGEVAVLLAHQGTPGADQTTWQTFAQILADHGFTALTFDFRGKGESGGQFSPQNLDIDVKAAIQYLQDQNFKEIICTGASMGGTACMRAALDGADLKAIAIIASGPVAGSGSNSLAIDLEEFANLKLPKLFLTANEDYPAVVRDTRKMYDASPDPKEIHILPGNVHGTDLFETPAGDDMTAILLRFLTAPGSSPYHDASFAAELKGTTGPIYIIAWSPDRQWLASSGYQQIKIWDLETMLEYKTLEGPADLVWGLAWSPDGRYLAGAGQYGLIQLWETGSFEKIAEFNSPWAFALAWSPDSQSLAAGTVSGTVQIWDIETEEIYQELSGSSTVLSLAWHPDGELLAQGLYEGEINIWNTVSGELENTLDSNSIHRDDANGLAWSADGSLLASAHQDQSVRIWDVRSGEQVEISPLLGHTWWVTSVAWSKNGQCIASGGQDARLRIWDTTRGEMLTSLINGSQTIWEVAWSPDGQFLAVSDGRYNSMQESGSIWVWRIIGCGS
jgi:WD40 repeat protein